MNEVQRATLAEKLTLFGVADDDVTILAETDEHVTVEVGARKGRPKRLTFDAAGALVGFANTTGRA